MILTGPEIIRERNNGRLTIDPFREERVNPNSYNFRLDRMLHVYRDFPLDPRHENVCEELAIPSTGLTLRPHRLYLASTIETLGSSYYAPTFAARSSVARLGLFINLSASLGDIGFVGQWTLQLYCLHPVVVFAKMEIGQMMFWRPQGSRVLYDGKYQNSRGPTATRIHQDFERRLRDDWVGESA